MKSLISDTLTKFFEKFHLKNTNRLDEIPRILKKVNFGWELISRDSSRFRFYTPFSLLSGSTRGGETSRFQFLFLRDNPLKVFVVWQYPSKVKHAETRNSYSSRTSEIYPLGRLVVCTTKHTIKRFRNRQNRQLHIIIHGILHAEITNIAYFALLLFQNSEAYLFFNNFVKTVFLQLIEKSSSQRFTAEITR